jgi:hydrogenase-4 component F
MLIYAVLAVPLAAGAIAAAAPWRRSVGWLATAANAAVLVLGITLAAQATHHRLPVVLGGVLRADALTAFMVVVIGVIAVLASSQSVRYLNAEIERGACTARHAALYTALVQTFVTCMLVAVLAASLGVMWGGGSHDDHHHLPRRPPPHRRGTRGVVEIRGDLLGRHRTRVPGNRALLLR